MAAAPYAGRFCADPLSTAKPAVVASCKRDSPIVVASSRPASVFPATATVARVPAPPVPSPPASPPGARTPSPGSVSSTTSAGPNPRPKLPPSQIDSTTTKIAPSAPPGRTCEST
eukprot:scaffold8611_cov108-Isochrysis_galbana.AAC.1